MSIVDTHIILKSKNRHRKHPVRMEFKDDRIWFLSSPFAAKDEIKAMQGAKWHGFEENPKKMWSVADTPRNRFNLDYLQGKDVYEWFDRPLVEHELPERLAPKLMGHQTYMANIGLTYHYAIFAAEMGVGKTLASQTVIEASGKRNWIWIGPKNTLVNIQYEFEEWGFPFDDINIEFISFENNVKRVKQDFYDGNVPDGLIIDEASKVKTAKAQRTKSAQYLADLIRDTHDKEGYVLELTGTPATKSPVNWWAQSEIAWPGYLKEGSPQALEKRVAFMREEEYQAGVFKKRFGWKDDENKCEVCGLREQSDELDDDEYHNPDDHEFVPSVNEVEYLGKRLKGLAWIFHKKDCIDLPPKRYRVIRCKPSSSTKRAAKALVETAPNVITGLTWLRELSDGFLYKNEPDGKTKCTHCEDGKIIEWRDPNGDTFSNKSMFDPEYAETLEAFTTDCRLCKGTCKVTKYIRTAKQVKSPKIGALSELMKECEETGRIVIFAGFTGSVDRITDHCIDEGWDVVRCDGRGMTVLRSDGEPCNKPGIRYWKNWDNNKVAFVAHPESGGYGLTLTEARMAVFYSNVHKSEVRVQAEDRIHRKGMDENLGCEIVDLLHLPTDERVLELIKEDRRIELMTMGEFTEGVELE